MNPLSPFDSLIEEWSYENESFLRNIGSNPYLGHMLSIFLLSDKPITQEELAELLNISIASVSRCIKTSYEKWNIITRIRLPDSRKKYYTNRQNTHVGLIISVILSLLETFRSHQVALDGIISQHNALSGELRESKEGGRFNLVVEDMRQSTRLIGEELTKVVTNLQSQFKVD